MKSQRVKENELRTSALEWLIPLLEERYGEVYIVPTTKGGSVENYSLACPCLDSENDEAVIKFDVTIPRGERNSDGYDVYGIAEAFKEEREQVLREREEKEKKKKAEEELKELKKLKRKKHTKKVEDKADEENA